MAEREQYLYHCDRCGELFKSKRRATEDLRCETCGEHPVLPKFNALTDFQVTHKLSKKRKLTANGTPVADSQTRQKRHQLKQWLIIAAMSAAVIGVITMMAIRMNEKSMRASRTDVVLSPEDTAYLVRRNEALNKCRERFKLFDAENIFHAKSAHIYKGSDLILDINRYYQNSLVKSNFTSSQMTEFELIENEELPKAVALYRTQADADQATSAYEFEVLFRKKDNDWLIDWAQFVRLGDMIWFNFNDEKKTNSPKKFSLYMRQPNARSFILNGYEEYKLSEPFNNSTFPSRLSSSAFIKQQAALKSKLNQKFKELEEREKQGEGDIILARFDPPGTIRVLVTVDFEEIEGEAVMVIREIHQLNWETNIE